MKIKLLIFLVLAVLALNGCSPSVVVETPDIDGETRREEPAELLQEEETEKMHPDQENLFSAMQGVGLDWDFSSRHMDLFLFDERYQLYFISSPFYPILGMIEIRTGAGDGIFGEENIAMTFALEGVPPEEAFQGFREIGLLSQEEWMMFWQLAGTMVGAEAHIEELAQRAIAYLEGFSFQIYNEEKGHYYVFLDGQIEDLDYHASLEWNPFLEQYSTIRIDLTIGLSEQFRASRRELDFSLGK